MVHLKGSLRFFTVQCPMISFIIFTWKLSNHNWYLVFYIIKHSSIKVLCNISHWLVMNQVDVVDRYIWLLVKSTKWFQKQALHGCKAWPVKGNHHVGVGRDQWKARIAWVWAITNESHALCVVMNFRLKQISLAVQTPDSPSVSVNSLPDHSTVPHKHHRQRIKI